MTRRFDGVVFDLDGTLVHTAPDIHAAVGVMMTALGRPSPSLAVVTSFIGNGVERLVTRCLDHTGGATPALVAEGLALFNPAYAAAPAVLSRPYPGVASLLNDLSQRGLKRSVCTNKPQAMADDLLDQTGLAGLIDTVLGAGTVALKPDPAPLLLCLDRLNLAPAHCLFVGDSPVDAETAAAAGVPFALFLGGYGHGFGEPEPGTLRFSTYAELADVFD